MAKGRRCSEPFPCFLHACKIQRERRNHANSPVRIPKRHTPMVVDLSRQRRIKLQSESLEALQRLTVYLVHQNKHKLNENPAEMASRHLPVLSFPKQQTPPPTDTAATSPFSPPG